MPPTTAKSTVTKLDEHQRLKLLLAVAHPPGGHATQREVARSLGVSKAQARQQLRAAVAEGLVVEVLDDKPATPGRRLFSLSADQGTRALQLLCLHHRHLPGGADAPPPASC